MLKKSRELGQPYSKTPEYRKQYQSDPERQARIKQQIKESGIRRREAKRNLVNSIKQKGCIVCGEKTLCCIDFHHVDPATKENGHDSCIAKLIWGASMDRLMDELNKCVPICRNCHAKLHAGLITLNHE